MAVRSDCRFIFRNGVFSSISNSGRWTASKTPLLLSGIHHRQHPLDSIVQIYSFKFSQQKFYSHFSTPASCFLRPVSSLTRKHKTSAIHSPIHPINLLALTPLSRSLLPPLSSRSHVYSFYLQILELDRLRGSVRGGNTLRENRWKFNL
jgi:hypothetical protein